jgi:hypothetical protein
MLPDANHDVRFGPARAEYFGWESREKWGQIVLRRELLRAQVHFLELHKPSPIIVHLSSATNEAWRVNDERWENLEILDQLPWIRGLSLHHGNGGLDRISGLVNIERIEASEDVRCDFDVSRLPNLKRLSCSAKQLPHNISRTRQLASIKLHSFRPASSDLRMFTQYDEMSSIELVSTNIKSLDGIENCKKLNKLSIAYASNLEDWSAIRSVAGSIQCLLLESVKRLELLKLIPYFDGARQVHLINCGEIESLDFTRCMPSLRQLWFVGTKVANGKVRFLREVPKLKSVNFRNSRGYDARWEEFNEDVRHFGAVSSVMDRDPFGLLEDSCDPT